MLKFTDSGCAQHPPRHTTLKGLTAELVGHLIINLPQTNAGHTYICKHGHTHCLTLQMHKGNVAKSPSPCRLTGNTVINH
jgi:hypothetical protein